MTIKALIFDFDGIITDTEPVHTEAWLSVLEPIGLEFDDEEWDRAYIGLNNRDFLDAVAKTHGHHFSESDKANLIERKNLACLDLLATNIPLIKGVDKFIEAASERYLLAICSGAERGEIDFILRRVNLYDHFIPIISANDVKRGKPDPEGYIRAFEGLRERSEDLILPEHILAIEDAPRGIKAAKAAGFKCLAVTTSFHSTELMHDATRVVESLEDVDVENLLGYH